jgi:hypothetical protein
MSQSMIFGDLALQFTCQFTPRWSDKGSKSTSNGSFWQPVPPAGFKAFGSIGVEGYDDPSNTVAALCVAEAHPGGTALRPPTSYTQVWNDKGSHADKDGSCWRPVPPTGYVALGDVFVQGHKSPPSLADVVCVRADLVGAGVHGGLIWSLRSDDFGAWQVTVPAQYVDANKGLIAVNSFVGEVNEGPPNSLLRCLCLPLPAQALVVPPPPVLTSRSKPDETTPAAVDRIVWVPFTAVRDPATTLVWKMANSPFYQLQRLAWYRLLLHDDNDTAHQREQRDFETVGVSRPQSQEFGAKTGVSVTAEGGVSFMGGEVAATVSIELGFPTTTGIEQFHEKTIPIHLIGPAHTASALWAVSYGFRLLPADSTEAPSTQPAQLDFMVDSLYRAYFPAVGVEGQPQAQFFELPPIAEQVPT